MSPQTGPTDRDSPSFEALYERHGARVLNVIHRMTGDADIARDLAQDVWVQVYRNLDRFEARADFFTWIYRIAVNRTLNYLKQAKRRKFIDLPSPGAAGDESRDDPVAGLAAPDEGAERALEREELARHLWNAIQSLDPKYRVPIVLFHYEEQTYQEIAATMGLSLTAVQARIFRARKQLAERLGPLLDQL
ncbi:MAG TPA: sigma-70 family RNA polymerase sigma factor [Candidatus Krumholzibacteria bacterium]